MIHDKIILKPVTDYEDDACEKFMYLSNGQSLDYYKNIRNQDNPDKIKNDIYNGKKAEYMVFNKLNLSDKVCCTPPDTSFYPIGRKSWDPDLYVIVGKKAHSVHVKSCLLDRYSWGNSWVFTKDDPLFRTDSDNDYLALCVLSNNINYMYLIKFKDAIFKEPQKEDKKDTKICIYEKDLLLEEELEPQN